MKKRALFSELLRYFEHKNALVITGMRQVGKTTIMKQLYENCEYPRLWFDFENPFDRIVFEKTDYKVIHDYLVAEAKSRGKRLFVFIDEIQNFPDITRIIKYFIDHYRVKFIVTGSLNYYLRNLFPESLSGRKFLFELPPLSFQEFLYFKEKKEKIESSTADFPDNISEQSELNYLRFEYEYSEYLQYGGFPEVVTTNDNATKKLILTNILKSFFEKDIRLLSDLKDIRELRDLILLLVPRTGNMLDIIKLASELGVSRVKVYDYLELLKGTFFIKLIPKYSSKPGSRVAGGKKVYFSDTGILNVLGSVTEGQLFENCVANQLSAYGDLSFYNHRNTAEIDFILDWKKGFEVKLKGDANDLTRLRYLSEKLKLKEYFLISRNTGLREKVIFPASL